MNCKDQVKYLEVGQSGIKGRYIRANCSIPPYTNVASFGCRDENRVSVKVFQQDANLTQMIRYAVRDLTDDHYVYVPTRDEMHTLEDPKAAVNIATFPCAFLVNEPYLEKELGSEYYTPVEENVEIVRNDHTGQVYLMTIKHIQEGDELLWFYGHRYPCPRDYMVFAPELNLDYRVLEKTNRLIVYDARPQLPEAIHNRRKNTGYCTTVTFTKSREDDQMENQDDFYTFDFVPSDSNACKQAQAMTDKNGISFTYRLSRMLCFNPRSVTRKKKKT